MYGFLNNNIKSGISLKKIRKIYLYYLKKKRLPRINKEKIEMSKDRSVVNIKGLLRNIFENIKKWKGNVIDLL